MKVEIKFNDVVEPVVYDDVFLWDWSMLGGFLFLKRPGFVHYFNINNIREFKIVEGKVS